MLWKKDRGLLFIWLLNTLKSIILNLYQGPGNGIGVPEDA